MTAAEVHSVLFGTSLGGYATSDVDSFFEVVETTLGSRESGLDSGSPLVSAGAVERVTFRAAFRGYDHDEVDDFLDRVVTTLSGNEPRNRGSLG